ncbi:hypothetical protein [Candidatus Formimonas warabiya]|uniref:Uncharacterized protein n=1 Tax=Formimonas warabiya TaxID=1761012 RepID=A0A3G1KQE3_FORW1|nr:hypothetical protein [Candidatus Formimonas warabiya]ATW24689.1 hypothetical protein DCMF_07785 [Candidatus Formimonas warabiya]
MKQGLWPIRNLGKKGKGWIVFPLILMVACTIGVFLAWQNRESQAAEEKEILRVAGRWAEGLKQRDGRLRYDDMTPALQKEFKAYQQEISGNANNWVIGGSSPWVESYEIDVQGMSAFITYLTKTSNPATFIKKEELSFTKEKGKLVVAESYEADEFSGDFYTLFIPWSWARVNDNTYISFFDGAVNMGGIEEVAYEASRGAEQFTGNQAKVISTESIDHLALPAYQVVADQQASSGDHPVVRYTHYYFLSAEKGKAVHLYFETDKVAEKDAQRIVKSFSLIPEETVTDGAALSRLWDGYLYFAITSIGNEPFTDGTGLSVFTAVDYVIPQIVKDGAYELLENGDARIDDKTLSQYIKKYFMVDIESFHPETDFPGGIYHEEQDSWNISILKRRLDQAAGYQEGNAWGMWLGKVTKNSHGVITATMESRVKSTGRVELTNTYTLQEGPEGTLYFVRMVRTYPAEKHVVLKGDYTSLNLADFGIEQLSSEGGISAGNVGDHLLVQGSKSDAEFPPVSLTLYDLAEEKILKKLPVSLGDDGFVGLRRTDDKVIVKFLDGFCYTDHALTALSEKITIPRELVAGHEKRWHYDSFRYDVSADLQSIVYTAGEGLYLYNLSNRKSTLLAENIPAEGKAKDDFGIASYPLMDPYFINGDKGVAVRIGGYEGDRGMMIVTLDKPVTPRVIEATHPFIWNWAGVSDQIPQWGYVYDEEKNINSAYTVAMAKFDPWEILPAQEISMTSEQLPLIDASSNMVYNDKYIAYTSQLDDNYTDPAERRYTINIVDLSTLKAETVLELKAGCPAVYGVTEDGRVLFGYSFEQETGFGITR